MNYVTIAEVRQASAFSEHESIPDAQIEFMLGSVSRAIDNYTKRWFYARQETRYYTPQSSGKLVLDAPLISLLSVKNGTGVTMDIAKMVLYPRNAESHRWIELPSVKLVSLATPTLWYQSPILTGEYFVGPTVAVTGSWGFTQIPDPVVRLAAVSWVTYLINALNNPGVSSKSIGGFSTGYTGFTEMLKEPPGHVKLLLDGLRQRRISSFGSGAW